MKALRIDFVPASPARAWHAAGPGLRLALLAAVAACGFVAALAVSNAQALAASAQSQRTAEAARPVRPARAASAPVVAEDEAAAVNGAVERLNLPWRDVFDAIEQATPDSVALLAIEPDAKRDVVRIVAEAGGTEDMLRYVERLKQQPFLTAAFLTRHDVDQADTNLPLRFQVEAHWRRVAP